MTGAGETAGLTAPGSLKMPSTSPSTGRVPGRREIAASHQQLFDKFLKGTRLTGRVLSMKFVRPDVALIHATGGTVMRDKTKPSPERDSIQTLVAVREGAEWRFAAFHNSRVRPIGSNAATFLSGLSPTGSGVSSRQEGRAHEPREEGPDHRRERRRASGRDGAKAS